MKTVTLKKGFTMSKRAVDALIEATNAQVTRYQTKSKKGCDWTYNVAGFEFSDGGKLARHLLNDINTWMQSLDIVNFEIIENAHMAHSKDAKFFEVV